MQTYFTSDLHLGHKNISKYRPDLGDNDEYILSLLGNLDKRSIVYVLGDFLFDGPHFNSYLERISAMKCQIRVVMGNHDSKLLYTQTIAENIRVELPLFCYKSKWVSHCPIHPNEIRGRLGNIHGHMHLESLPDTRYFNVNIDCNNYDLVKVETINNHFKE